MNLFILATEADAFAIFHKGIDVFQKIIIMAGAGYGLMGLVHLIEGFSDQNPQAKNHGMKVLISGIGIVLVGIAVTPMLKGFFK